MSGLADRTCEPCSGDVPALEGPELEELRRQVPDWDVVEGHHLMRKFRFTSFREALDFVNRVGEIAEEQGHHPDVAFGWGYAEVTVFTHAIDGLTENDFILAAKVDRL
jgi:4a-hydroxytetrahydrobiopterin dehydratase